MFFYPAIAYVDKSTHLSTGTPWLGWAYLAKTVRKSQRGGVNFDPPVFFCACPMQNAPAASGMLPGDFRTK
jgi:hypothetical protein